MSDAALHRLGCEGPDVLLIHGFGADRLSWLALAPQLFPFATVWACEFGGHGVAGNDVGKGTLRLRLRSPAGWQSRVSSVIRWAVRLALFWRRAAR